jgi:hypothetical protein
LNPLKDRADPPSRGDGRTGVSSVAGKCGLADALCSRNALSGLTELLPGKDRDAVEFARRVRDSVIPLLAPYLADA